MNHIDLNCPHIVFIPFFNLFCLGFYFCRVLLPFFTPIFIANFSDKYSYECQGFLMREMLYFSGDIFLFSFSVVDIRSSKFPIVYLSHVENHLHHFSFRSYYYVISRRAIWKRILYFIMS